MRQETREELESLNEDAINIAALERKIAVLTTSYLAHSQKMEDARIQQSMADQRLSSVNVLEPASYSTRPVGLGKQMTLLLGLFTAAIAAVATAFVADHMNHSFSSSQQVEQALHVPVLVSIPKKSKSEISRSQEAIHV